MILRPYDAERDRDAVHRIFYEVGWSDRSKEQEEGVDLFLGAGSALVAELHGAAECVAIGAPATYRYQSEDLPLCAITNVATSHVGRRQGLALRLTARLLQQAAGEGALVAALGIFDQGFYDRLGFGTGPYDHWLSFDPATLKVDAPRRVPQRVTLDDWEAIHAARLARPRRHGAISLHPAALTRVEMLYTRSAFGLGYRDGPGGMLSHLIWCGARGMERGPVWVRWLVYHDREQLQELMALLKGLGDQVRLVAMMEPPGMQLQDLIQWPFKQRQITEKSPFEAVARAVAWWQMRILDLPGCLARTHLPGPEVRFTLHLTDPVERYLDAGGPWRGVAGDYVVTLGPASRAERGSDPALPTLTASVNAFTRLWIGVRPATGLALTDDLAGPRDLLDALDAALRLPTPLPGWEF